MTAEIRLVSGEELLAGSVPLRAYAFEASPTEPDREKLRRAAIEPSDRRTHVIVDGDRTMATATVFPMTQNVRGALLPMGALAAVATNPMSRRRGHARALLEHLLRDMVDRGQVVSALYPFRASFYERFGYVGMPQQRTATLDPRELARLLPVEPPGTVELVRNTEAADEMRALAVSIQPSVHGMAIRSETDFRALTRRFDRWTALAKVDGEIVGLLVYQIPEYGGALEAVWFLYRDPQARTLLLGWLARHADQVATAEVPVLPGETPETWLTDLTVTIEAKAAPLSSPAPMVRVLSVPGLAGLPVGPGDVTLAVTDSLIGGEYRLTGVDGRLEIGAPAGEPAAAVTGHGLAALVYGLLDPAELGLRGYGQVDPATQQLLRTMFPRQVPFLLEAF